MTHSAALRIGLIGLGAIGREVARAITDGRAGRAKLCAVLVRNTATVEATLANSLHCPLLSDSRAFHAVPMDLVVEAAGQEALRENAETVLASARDLMLVSVGAFADSMFWERVRQTARERGSRVYVVSGAIGGLDAISAAAIAGLDEVTHVIRKPPRSLVATSEAVEIERSGSAREIFVGSARDAAFRFPENVNVAVAVSLAGIGVDKTIVRIVADPSVRENTHDIVARGYFGEIRVQMSNVPSSNPKTARLAALSVVKAIRNLTSEIVVGA